VQKPLGANHNYRLYENEQSGQSKAKPIRAELKQSELNRAKASWLCLLVGPTKIVQEMMKTWSWGEAERAEGMVH